MHRFLFFLNNKDNIEMIISFVHNMKGNVLIVEGNMNDKYYVVVDMPEFFTINDFKNCEYIDGRIEDMG